MSDVNYLYVISYHSVSIILALVEKDGTVSNQTVKHAPDLLEGPSLDSNGRLWLYD